MKIFDLSKINRNFAFCILHFAFIQRTVYAKTLPSVKFFGTTMSNVYAIGC